MIFKRFCFLCNVVLLMLSSYAFASELNDPTRPIYSENASSSILTNRVIKENKMAHLQSIFISKNKKVAVLNGEVVEEGLVTNDMYIVAIHSGHIVVRYKNNQINVKLASKVYFDKVTGEIRE